MKQSVCMKICRGVWCISLVMTTNLSFADNKFDGIYFQFGSGSDSNTIDAVNLNTVSTFTNGNQQADSFSIGEKSFRGAPANGSLGFNTRIGSNWLLGLGAEFSSLSKTSVGQTITGSTTGNTIPNVQYSVPSRYGVFLTSGLLIAPDKMMYVKAGYSRQKINISGSGNTSGSQKDPPFSITDHVNGYALGIGYKQFFTEKFYFFGEANYMKYQKSDLNFSYTATDSSYSVQTTNINPRSRANTVLIGLGYQF
jgi:outer membrane immunogenic protein